MESIYRDDEAAAHEGDPVAMRVYTSRLLGREPTLVLHGGGNTSVKVEEPDLFGKMQARLYVKGSGWDLSTIEREGFSPVAMDTLLRMVELPTLSDSDMVRAQRAAMSEPNAPNPSVEAILHAVIPFTFVDHTHADAVVAITNSPGGDEKIKAIYGSRVVLVPYVMPGFKLAQAIHELIRDQDWSGVEGLILLNHGVFTFGATGEESYLRMIRLVSDAEVYLEDQEALTVAQGEGLEVDRQVLVALRGQVSKQLAAPVVALPDRSSSAVGFSCLEHVADLVCRGPVTPDHVIRTKPKPLLLTGDSKENMARFSQDYQAYFERQAQDGLICLDGAPRWCVWPGHGTVAFGRTVKEAAIVRDINRHTMRAMQWGEALGGWTPLGETDIFEMEYWELEQAKLKRGKTRPPMAGQVAVVTGAASGIGRAVSKALLAEGAAVVGVDRSSGVKDAFSGDAWLGVVADLTDTAEVDRAIAACVDRFGGLDFLVSNAGTFPPGQTVESMDDGYWSETLDINLSSHLKVIRAASPFLRHGIRPAVVIVASKNVPAPGPGVGAYSVAKAGLTQLGRVSAMELGKDGVRVNMLHPNAVFDTGIWSEEKIGARAEHYGVSPEAYRRRNILGVEIDAEQVADLVLVMLGPAFSATTGAQIPVDGGNERVI
jgi:rhamnose utilization protein RhaD (predicted bifunctional aldolase and dehydrogenase)/NAD(P)-dependent dehydrogenase (short-subunit alcohol dehydrogenase family)